MSHASTLPRPLLAAARALKGLFFERLAIFSQTKVLENRPLNWIGTQIFRIILARGLLRVRRALFYSHLKRLYPECEVLVREGIVIIPNFLPEEDFRQVREGFYKAFSEQSGEDVYAGRFDTEVRKIRLNTKPFPAFTDKVFNDPRLIGLLTYGEARRVKVDGNCWLERVRHAGANADRPDPQLRLHRDIYFTTHKMLFYVNDVAEELGPFAYVKGSNHLTWERIAREYRGSIKKKPEKGLRQSPDPRVHGMVETKAVGKANTLVVADVFGFHRRADAAADAWRDSIRLGVRANPFSLSWAPSSSSADGD